MTVTSSFLLAHNAHIGFELGLSTTLLVFPRLPAKARINYWLLYASISVTLPPPLPPFLPRVFQHFWGLSCFLVFFVFSRMLCQIFSRHLNHVKTKTKLQKASAEKK